MNRHLEDPHVIECEADLEWLYEHIKYPRMECGWCARRERFKHLESALSWFQGHDCGTDGDIIPLDA